MAPLIALIAAFAIFRALGFVVPFLADWQHALRAALGVMFLLTASAHWGKRRPDLVRMVPSRFGSPGLWVTLTGFAELAIAIGLQTPRLAPWSAVIAVLMLCCLLPANLKAAREHLTILRKSVLPAAPRILLQFVFIAALVASVCPR
jgi:uncharacterized membrane protein